MMQGTPGSDTPDTFRPGACRCTMYQVAGTVYSRCGSFASRGLPLAVCAARDRPGIGTRLKFTAASRKKKKEVDLGGISAGEHGLLLQLFLVGRGEVAIHLEPGQE